MNKIRVIAIREYNAAVRTKAFLVSLILMPVLTVGGIAVQKLLEGRVDVIDKRVAVRDETGVLMPRLLAEAERRNKEDITNPSTGKQTDPRFILEPVAAAADAERVRMELSDRVRKHEIAAFVEIPASVFNRARPAEERTDDDGEQPQERPRNPLQSTPDLDAAARGPHKAAAAPGDWPQIRFYSDNQAQFDLTRWLGNSINNAIRGERLARAGLDPKVVAAATANTPLETLGLYERTASGEVRKAEKSSREMAIFVPMIVMMMMFMVIMVAAQPLLQSVLEEKQQRIAEVLLGSASPFQIMMGKLLGNVGVSITIIAVYMLGGHGVMRYFGMSNILPRDLLFWFLAFQVLAVLLFGSVFIAIGAACTELREAQSLVTPVMLMMLIPLFVWFNAVREPLSKFALVLSLFPPATPMMMILRMVAAKGLPVWQPLLGMALTLATTVGCVWAAGRVFRIGLLSQGKAPRLHELLKWVLRG